ncbi:MAG: type IV toxin-antitoxin system AbiEi family antitoxin domain-containing protein [Candidatus Baldrarchaeia archaeon]
MTKYLLSRYGGKVATKTELIALCNRFNVNPNYFVNYIIRYGYAIRILRGLYYVKTVEEFKLGRIVNPLRVLALGMERLGVKWYFGLYTALRLNGVTHEYYDVIFVLSNSIYRPKIIKVAGENVKFIKINPSLVVFGLVRKDEIVCSDLEKTVLDFIYLSRYGSLSRDSAIAVLREYADMLNRGKLDEYVSHYPKTVRRVLVDEGIL